MPRTDANRTVTHRVVRDGESMAITVLERNAGQIVRARHATSDPLGGLCSLLRPAPAIRLRLL